MYAFALSKILNNQPFNIGLRISANDSKFGFDELPCGCVVGKVKLVDVKKYNNEEEHKKDNNLHLASSIWGNYGFVLENPERIKEIPCKGKLGFWDFDIK